MAEGKRGCGSPGGSAFWWGVVSEKLLRRCYKEKLSLRRKVYIPRWRGGGKSFQEDETTCAKPPKHETSLSFWRTRMECELYGEQQREKGWSSWCQSQRGFENHSEEPEFILKAAGWGSRCLGGNGIVVEMDRWGPASPHYPYLNFPHCLAN